MRVAILWRPWRFPGLPAVQEVECRPEEFFRGKSLDFCLWITLHAQKRRSPPHRDSLPKRFILEIRMELYSL
jgi:hypothetical protein